MTRLPTAAKRRVKNPVALDEAGNVEFLGGFSRVAVPAERVLHQAGLAGLTQVIVVGVAPDGTLYFAGSEAQAPDILWLLELAKRQLLENAAS
ncbi:hypothetical protein [Methylobacterium sp. XJLW]|uniref:hypothetical protein n=1 Tax=Methylobacterium sp. XJLW TaxID=739141 RepID=UPI000F5507E6|nr:hypothetical protein [Methylobacterium sp. XJLW]